MGKGQPHERLRYSLKRIYINMSCVICSECEELFDVKDEPNCVFVKVDGKEFWVHRRCWEDFCFGVFFHDIVNN